MREIQKFPLSIISRRDNHQSFFGQMNTYTQIWQQFYQSICKNWASHDTCIVITQKYKYNQNTRTKLSEFTENNISRKMQKICVRLLVENL